MTDSQTPYSNQSSQVSSRQPVRPRRSQQRERRSSSGKAPGNWLSWLTPGPQPRRRSKRSAPGPAPRSRPVPKGRREAKPGASQPFFPPEDYRTAYREPGPRRRTASAAKAAAWPPRSQTTLPLPKLPTAPTPVLYGLRLGVLGIGVAALAGTLLSVLSPADVKPGEVNTARTASRTESVLTSQTPETRDRNGLTLTQEIAPLKTQLLALPDLTPGLTASTYFLDLDTGKYVDINGQEAIAAASTIKLPILVAFFKEVDAGRISVEQTLMLRAEQIVGGSGQMQGQPPGTKYTALEVATQMIIASDNTATNMMIELLGGPVALNAQFKEWGLSGTVINNPLPDLEGTNTTSAQDLVKMMAFIHQGKLLSLRSRDRVLNILQRTHNKALLPAGLGEGALAYNKTGDIGQVLGDVALIDLANGKRYAIATLVKRPNNDGRARELIRRISQTVYQTMASTVAPMLPPGEPSTPPVPGATPERAPNQQTPPTPTEARPSSGF